MGPYELQRGLYALALSRARELPSVETAYVFLNRADEPVLMTLQEDQFSEMQESLRSTLEEIKAGRFFGAGSTGSGPCRDCWACDLLAAQIKRAAAGEV